jgi:hypothetical protein
MMWVVYPKPKVTGSTPLGDANSFRFSAKTYPPESRRRFVWTLAETSGNISIYLKKWALSCSRRCGMAKMKPKRKTVSASARELAKKPEESMKDYLKRITELTIE